MKTNPEVYFFKTYKHFIFSQFFWFFYLKNSDKNKSMVTSGWDAAVCLYLCVQLGIRSKKRPLGRDTWSHNGKRRCCNRQHCRCSHRQSSRWRTRTGSCRTCCGRCRHFGRRWAWAGTRRRHLCKADLWGTRSELKQTRALEHRLSIPKKKKSPSWSIKPSYLNQTWLYEPVNSGLHWQLYVLTPSTQVPPFWHSWPGQSLMLWSQFLPENPKTKKKTSLSFKPRLCEILVLKKKWEASVFATKRLSLTSVKCGQLSDEA